MKYLTVDDVYAIHQQMILIGGGRGDIHDFTLLHSAVERIKVTFGGKELYTTIWKKSSALIHSLVKNHPFDDGNKRTAYYSMKRFLWMNGYYLFAEEDDLLPFMKSIDVDNLSLSSIEDWIKKHSRKV